MKSSLISDHGAAASMKGLKMWKDWLICASWSVFVCAGCVARDAGPDLFYPPDAGVLASYELDIRNEGSAPILLQIDNQQPIELKRSRLATLPHGIHSLKVTTPEDPTFALAQRCDVRIDQPGILQITHDPVKSAPEARNLRYLARRWGRVYFHSPNVKSTVPIAVRFERPGRLAEVHIDDYPPLYVSNGPLDLELPIGNHRVKVVTSGPNILTGNNFGTELSGHFNFNAPGYLDIFESTCPKDQYLEGLHYPLRAGEHIITHTYTLTATAGIRSKNKR